MRIIEKEDSKQTLDNMATKVYESDNKQFDDFTSGKSKTMDFSSLKRLILSELSLKKTIKPRSICGFTRQQIKNMAQMPERYGDQILRLMDYMYQKSGYMKRLVDYFSNMPSLNYYIDTEALNSGFLKVKEGTLQNNFMKFAGQASKFNLRNNIHDIYKRLYLNDICYAFVVETDIDISYYFLDPRYCQIQKIVNGNVLQFAINRSLLSDVYIESLPAELQALIEQSKTLSLSNLVDIPFQNSFCIKYNSNFLHLFPPLYPMVLKILAVEDYEDLAKSQAINDAYKLLVFQVPTKDGEITMDDKTLQNFISVACKIVPDNIGVVPYPGDVDSVQFTSDNDDDRDKVEDAITQMYSEMGVSEALMSGASSGSELKLSITNDSGDVFRIYRMLENWVSLQMKLRGYIYKSYQFTYKILDITIFNQTEVIDEELKLAQASLPNKMKLCAAAGISPSSLIGSSVIENVVFKDIFETFQPLKSSYTESSSDEESEEFVGAPTKDDTEISEITETTRNNDGNDPDNRV